MNSTDSKATATWRMNDLRMHVPEILQKPLCASRYYARSSDTIVIQAQTSRKRNENEKECHERLLRVLQSLSKDVVPGETSIQQKAKVEVL